MGGGGGGAKKMLNKYKQWCSQRISWVHILWCIMGSDFFGGKSPKESTFFLREYFVANFLF
jgi:hypothetical protein